MPNPSKFAVCWLASGSEAPRWGIGETLALVLYLAVVSFGIAQHVPWADEAQAWLLAQGVSLPTLLIHSLHYEGTPGLWHCLLKLLQWLHVSFTGARWVAGVIAASGIVVLLGWAPFPRLVRLLLPFSFFLAYQDAVIARSYVLFAVLAFAACALLRSARPRPLRLALVLGLMANISLHGLLASIGLGVVTAVLARRRTRLTRRMAGGVPTRSGAERDTPGRLPSGRSTAATLLLCLFWIAALATMAPARDVDFSAGNNVWRSLAKFEKDLGFRSSPPPSITSLPMAGLDRAPLPTHLREGRQRAWVRIARTLSVITYPLSRSRLLALLLLVLIAVQAFAAPSKSLDAPIDDPVRNPENKADSPPEAFARSVVYPSRSDRLSRRGSCFEATLNGAPLGALGLAPYLLMVVIFTSLYLEPRHAGMVFTCLIASAWLTWPVHLQAGWRLRLEQATTLVFALVLVLQAGWTFHALLSEHAQVYSPDREIADYLAQRGLTTGRPLAGFYYYSVAPLLYFDHNLYFNQPAHRYWSWSTEMRTYSTAAAVLARHPAAIVVGGFELGPDAEITRDWLPASPPEPGVHRGDVFFVRRYFLEHGYHEAKLFCGHSWMRDSYAEQQCQTILEPDPPALRP